MKTLFSLFLILAGLVPAAALYLGRVDVTGMNAQGAIGSLVLCSIAAFMVKEAA